MLIKYCNTKKDTVHIVFHNTVGSRMNANLFKIAPSNISVAKN